MLNHELSQEDKPAEGTEQTKKKERGESGVQLLQTERKDEAKSDEQSKNHLMDSLCFAKGDKTNTSQLSELSVICFSLSLYQHVYTAILSTAASKPLWTL